MKMWYTTIEAIDPQDGELKLWAGPKIQAPTYEAAKDFCQDNGLGFLNVVGEFIGERPTFEIGPERLN